MILVPDTKQPKLYRDAIEPNLKPGKTLISRTVSISVSAHQAVCRRRRLHDRSKSSGHRVREVFTEGGGTPALLAVEQDASALQKR